MWFVLLQATEAAWYGSAFAFVVEWISRGANAIVVALEQFGAWFVTQLGVGISFMLWLMAQAGLTFAAGVYALVAAAANGTWPSLGSVMNTARNWTTGTGMLEGNELLGVAGRILDIFVNAATLSSMIGVWMGVLLAGICARGCLWIYHQFWGSN